jgi:hypothetical protein
MNTSPAANPAQAQFETQRGIDTRLAYATHRYNVALASRQQNPRSDAAKREFLAAEEHLRTTRTQARDIAVEQYVRGV